MRYPQAAHTIDLHTHPRTHARLVTLSGICAPGSLFRVGSLYTLVT
jgi:hypothetical protein